MGSVHTRPGNILILATGLAAAAAAFPAAASAPEAAGTIATVAGTGTSGYSGDGGAATDATLDAPRTLAVDREGNVYVADTDNNVIRRIDPSGAITTIAGNGEPGWSGDGGPATEARITWPHSVAVDDAGNVYVADSRNHRIRRVDPTGVITTVAGTGRGGFSGDPGPATEAFLDNPKGVAVDSAGRLYIADTGNNRVRRVDPSGVIITVAGNGVAGGGGDGGRATEAEVTRPRAVAVDGAGNLYLLEGTEGEVGRIRKVDGDGIITLFAGAGGAGFGGDGGPATEALFNRPRDLAADAAGNVYVADSENQRVRKVDTSGTVTTIAGTGDSDFSGDGGPATEAELSVLRGVAVGPHGDLFLADTGNHRIRRIAGVAAPGPPTSSASPPPSSPGGSPAAPSNPAASPSPPAASPASGYWILQDDGRVYAFGDAVHRGDATPFLGGANAVDLEPTPSHDGYWIVDGAGRVYAFGDARHLGNAEAARLAAGERVTSLSATPSGSGYWLFTDRGRTLSFGDARAFGDMSAVPLNGPVLDSIPTPSGNGYYMVASDGGIFAFGDADFQGSMGGKPLNAPVQSLVPDGDGVGYWLVASDGGVFAFDAPFAGSMGSVPLNQPMTGMVPFGNAYLMVAEDGGIFNFATDRSFFGSLGANPPARPVVSVAALEERAE